jgi:hypothetical protein
VADRLAQGDERDLQCHEARKASKRLRYAAEAAAPVLGTPANRLVKQVQHVQELLGDHQDAVGARPSLRGSESGTTSTVKTGSPTACCTSGRPTRVSTTAVVTLGAVACPRAARRCWQHRRSTSVTR